MPRLYLSPPDVTDADRRRVAAVMTSPWVAPAGPELAAFEDAMGVVAGCPHAVALTSGTAALHLALQILGVNRGDRVLCASFTFAASANPICYLGAEPVFIDSEAETWNMDPHLLAEALAAAAASGQLPKAVIVVHLYGQCASMDPILEACARYQVPVIEDAAEALGASYKGRPAGSMGAVSAFSFNGNKIITTSGGGMLLSHRSEWIERARYLATQAREPVLHYEHEAVGYNYRMSNVLAGLGCSQLADLPRRIQRRREIFESYAAAFADLPGLQMMPLAQDRESNFWLSCLTLDPERTEVRPADLIKALEQADVESRPLWKPLHLQPVFADCGRFGGAVCERLFQSGLCLPSGSGMTASDVDKVAALVRSQFKLD